MRLWPSSVRQWHWISSAIGLAGLFFFAVTGLTLNHSGQLESPAEVRTSELQLPPLLLQQLQAADESALPDDVQYWLSQNLDLDLSISPLELSAEYALEAAISPRTHTSIQIDRETGRVISETTTQGWITFFNNLHTNRHDSLAWSWFIDFFAVSCIVFSASGLLLLKRQASGRPFTWPVMGLGLLLPLILILFFFH